MICKLFEALQRVCPVEGVTSDRVISFSPLATPQECAAAQAIADAWDFPAEEAKEAARRGVLSELESIDRASIRSIREWVAAQASAPRELKDAEAAAVAKREEMPGRA